MAGESVLAEIDAFEVRRGVFYDDTFGLVTDSPPASLAAALIGTTVAVLAAFVVSEIAGRYASRPRGGAR